MYLFLFDILRTYRKLHLRTKVSHLQALQSVWNTVHAEETKHIIRCKFMQCVSFFFLWMCEHIQPSHLFTHFLGNSPHLLGERADVIHTLASAPAHVTCGTVFLTFASSPALPLILLSSCCRSRRYGNCNYIVSPHFFLSLSLYIYIRIYISMSVHPVILIHA